MKSTKARTYEEKRITKYFMISNEKYRLSYTPKGNTKSLAVLLNHHILKFGAILRQIIQLKKYEIIKVYTKSMYIHEDEKLNQKFFEEIVVDDYTFNIYDLEQIRLSQDEAYSLFCRLEKTDLN